MFLLVNFDLHLRVLPNLIGLQLGLTAKVFTNQYVAQRKWGI
ncbi:hypothetical protein HMPREF3230_00843 [Gardnerella vaginalis]|uniref:Uncharacterized protein n=1 Tax=Gardnerella vaginalis TaxID=2702 RepID=A0A135Z5B4_GARVA|nr:hypothetical protein HMPREF3230_00843 [Gardnerella vaginalis]